MVSTRCETNPMPGCEECTGEEELCPNPLDSLQTVCYAVPDMDICKTWKSVCEVNEAHNDMEHFCDDRDGTLARSGAGTVEALSVLYSRLAFAVGTLLLGFTE